MSRLLRYTFDSRLSRRVDLVLDDVELELVERAAHVVEAVLRLDDDFVEPAGVRPGLGLLGQRAEVPLAAPVAAGAANPAVEHLPVLELHAVAQPRHEVHELGLVLVRLQLVHDLERDRRDHARVVGQRRLGDQDEELAVAQAIDDFLRGLLARELAEVLLDVLDLERAGFERVLLDQVFQ